MQRYPRWGYQMDKPLERRIGIARCWASCRISLLDSAERYEDSYAITQEFREWIVSLESKSSHLDCSILKVPNSFTALNKKVSESDELLEL